MLGRTDQFDEALGAPISGGGRQIMISLNQARLIVDKALQHARTNDYPPMTVAVLDAAGQLVAFAKEDNSSLLRQRLACAKALGALNMGVGSRSLAKKAKDHASFMNAVTILAEGNLIPVPGGVLIRDTDGRVIGAAGISGNLPHADEECAVTAIEATGLRADPGE